MGVTTHTPEQSSRDGLAMLRRLAEGTAPGGDAPLFDRLVRHAAAALGARVAFLAEPVGDGRARTLAVWSGDRLVPNFDYAIAGTPCAAVLRDGTQRSAVAPGDAYVAAGPDCDSYVGARLVAQDGTVLGVLCALDARPSRDDPALVLALEVFAARAAAELDRLRAERSLRASEERFRDLFDEAPIAYVHEDLETRFIRANRTARRVLGITEEEVPQTVGRSFIPDTPEAQARVEAALKSISAGTDTSGVILELRRKDDGRPIWIQWWSRPDPVGGWTRTMFIDITERVLMEQEQARLQAQNVYLQEEIKSVHNFEEIVGSSPALLRVLADVRRVAPTDASVLITGETGTGKELIARAIHSASRRASGPFIKINCAALPAGLVESELFGHERGAFSGALQRRIGRFELADGGTIFLDEIGEVPLDVQVKLLRVLQEREFDRVGGGTRRTDVRVVAATNRDLRRAMRDGTFREDLYYRLNVFPVHLPPLRERVEDVPLLVRFFVQKYAPRIGRDVERVEPGTLERLARYRWPGNVRELENIVERSLILSTSDVLGIAPEMLPADAASHEPPPRGSAATPTDLETVQREHIRRVLEATHWVVEGPRGAAARLGLKPATLRHRMKKLGIARG